ncbi:hypothetical protein BJY00DRAFT_282463 [Aspergillus carlsbadensis]|nr:hypothetical protein BJY00DRAFT_282463 [Aspergillus carlsbadensis]
MTTAPRVNRQGPTYSDWLIASRSFHSCRGRLIELMQPYSDQMLRYRDICSFWTLTSASYLGFATPPILMYLT